MTEGRWRITVTTPDWGQDHLSLEAVVAYVDGELAPGPHARASQHLGQCPECAGQVSAQGQARKALRTAGGPCLPSALLSTLRAIPQDTELPPPPPGLAMTADGQLVSVLRPDRTPAPDHRATPDRHEFAAGPAPAPLPVAPRGGARIGRLTAGQRRRVGTGVAVSGLALGALVFGTPATAPTTPSPPAPALDRSSGSVLVPRPVQIDARLQLGPTGPGPDVPTAER